MPHEATSLQPSLENTPSLSYMALSETASQQPEAGESSETDEKDRGSGTDTPSALLPPKDEATSDTSQPAPGAEFVVWWNEPADQDPENPMNWSSRKKWFNIITISVISFLVPLISSMLSPAVQQIMQEFNTSSNTFATFVVSIFVLGFACGPLILAPLSELYGRVLIYNITNVLFLCFTIGCALSQNQSMLLAFRFLSGFAGVATITIGSGTIADVMPREKRGKAVSIWSVGTILGPMVGPIIGGYVTEVLGWRWMFWVISIVVGLVSIFAFAVLRETYPVVLLERKAARRRRETGNPKYRSKLAPDITPRELFKRSIMRPSKLLLCCPIVTLMCTYVAVLYGILYLLFATYSFVFKEVYGYSTFAAGLVFLAGGIGTLTGLAYIAKFSDRNLKRRAASGKSVRPEDRLPLIITLPGALTFPMGLFLYGWTVEYEVHWIVPQIGTAITGFGSILIFVGIQTYLIDAFEGYAASVVGANAVLRGTAGALLPLSGLQLYEALGWGWGNSLLGFLTLAFAPVPLIIGFYGAKFRNSRINQIQL